MSGNKEAAAAAKARGNKALSDKDYGAAIAAYTEVRGVAWRMSPPQ